MKYRQLLSGNKLLPRVALAAMIILSQTGKAHALLDNTQYSAAEKVGFAFCKIAEIQPRFELWIEQSPHFAKTEPQDRESILSEESRRLEQGFHSFSPDEDLINIRIPVDLVINSVNPKDPKFRSTGITKTAAISLIDSPGFYFPFQIGNTWVAVIPQDIEKLTKAYMNDEQYKSFSENLKVFSNTGAGVRTKGDLEFSLRPVSVDVRKPVKINDRKMWPMLAEVGSLTLWTPGSDKKVLWEYSAPWFVTEDSKTLLDLYGE